MVRSAGSARPIGTSSEPPYPIILKPIGRLRYRLKIHPRRRYNSNRMSMAVTFAAQARTAGQATLSGTRECLTLMPRLRFRRASVEGHHGW